MVKEEKISLEDILSRIEREGMVSVTFLSEWVKGKPALEDKSFMKHIRPAFISGPVPIEVTFPMSFDDYAYPGIYFGCTRKEALLVLEKLERKIKEKLTALEDAKEKIKALKVPEFEVVIGED